MNRKPGIFFYKREGRNIFLHWWVQIFRLMLATYFKLFHNIQIKGRENIPVTGPVAIAPNHQSFYDAMLVGFPIPRPIHFMALKQYMDIPAVGWYMAVMGAFPIEGPNDRKAYANMLKTLKAGKALTIYPEGKRTFEGGLEPFNTGLARMSLLTGATIVPTSIVGAYECWPRQNRFPFLCKPIIVKFHKPIECEKITGKEQLKRRAEEVTEELRQVIDRRVQAWQTLQHRNGASAVPG